MDRTENRTFKAYTIDLFHYPDDNQFVARLSKAPGVSAVMPTIAEAMRELGLIIEDNKDLLVDCKADVWEHPGCVETIEDGCGSRWSKICSRCNTPTMQIVRPGKVQCSECG